MRHYCVALARDSVRFWLFETQFDRAMVGAEYLRVDLCVFESWLEVVAHDKIVNTPPHILLTRLKTV